MYGISLPSPLGKSKRSFPNFGVSPSFHQSSEFQRRDWRAGPQASLFGSQVALSPSVPASLRTDVSLVSSSLFFFFLYIVWWRRWRPFIENCLILGHDILVIIDMKVSGTINTSRIKDRVVAKNLDLQNWVYEIGVLERVPENVSGHRSFCHHPSTRRLSACSSVLIKACPSRVSLDWISSSPVPLLPPVPPVWHLPKSALSSKCLCGAFAGDQGLWVMQWCAPHLAVCALRIVVFQKCLWEHLNPGVPLDTNKEQIQIILLVI